MPTEEQRQRLREINRSRQLSQGGQGQPSPQQSGQSGVGRVWDAAKTAGKVLLDYPGMAKRNLIQLYGETKETQKERGNLAALGQLGREAISTQFDVASFLSGGLIPKTAGDLIDPSKNTQLGMQVEDAQQQFRETEGRDPTMSERYDLMRNVQYQAMPWLAENKKILGMDVSHDTLLGLPVEAAAIAGEIAFTGGTATAARLAAKQGAKQLARMGAKTNLDPAQKIFRAGVRGGTKTAQQALLLPTRLDNLIGATITKPIRYAGIGVAGGARLTKKTYETLANRIKRKGTEEGNLAEQAKIDVEKAYEELKNQGKIEDVLPGSNTPLAEESEFVQAKIKGPMGGGGPEASNRIEMDDFDIKADEPGDDFFGKVQAMWQKVDEFATKTMHDTNETLASINKTLINKNKSSKSYFQTPEVFVSKGTWTEKSYAEESLTKKAASQLRRFLSASEDKVEGVKTIITGETLAGIDMINKIFPGSLKTNMVGAGVRQGIRKLDADPNVVTGGLVENALESIKQGKEINLTFTDGWIAANRPDLVGYKFEGHTLVSPTYKGNTIDDVTGMIDSETGKILQVDPNLLPGYSDVMERASLYTEVLEAHSREITPEMLKEIGVKEIYGKGVGEEITLKELVDKLAKINKPWEDIAVEEGILFARSARGAMYDEGYGYQPRNPLGEITEEGVLTPRAKEVIIEGNFKKDAGFGLQPVEKRTYYSQAEGMVNGEAYLNPAIANANYLEFVLKTQRNRKAQEGLQRFGEEHFEGKYGSIAEILGESTIDRYYGNLAKVRGVLEAIAARPGIKRTKIADPNNPGKTMSLSERLIDINANIEASKFQKRINPDDTDEGIFELSRNEIKQFGNDLDKWTEDIEKILQGSREGWYENEKRSLRSYLEKAKWDFVNNMQPEVLRRVENLNKLGFEGHYFPTQFKEGIDSVLSKHLRAENPEGVRGTMMKLNSWLRTFGATGDFSAFGIQGWTAVLNDSARRLAKLTGAKDLKAVPGQGDSLSAVGASWNAFGEKGEQIVAEYFRLQEKIALQNPTLMITPTQAINEGLAVLGNVPDFHRFDNPILKKFDRAFTHYGNVLRYQLFSSELTYAAVKQGKNIDELITSGEARKIADAINVMTGVGRRGYGGDVGQFLLFSPRFFQARLAMLSKSLKGTYKGLMPGRSATIDERIARQYMARFMGISAFLTLSINEALGQPTDLNPLKENEATGEWYFNPNFMRTHVGDLDISFLGPHDTMLRILALPHSAALTAKAKGFSVDDMLEKFRSGISGPAVGQTWDFLAGEDVIGQITREKIDGRVPKPFEEDFFDSVFSGESFSTLMSNFVPFALDETFMSAPGKEATVPRTIKGAIHFATGGGEGRAEELEEAVTGVAQTAGQLFGVKSGYESLNESLNEVYTDITKLGPQDQRLQEAFNMSENELREYLANVGKDAFDSGQIKLTRLFSDEKTVSFDDLAADYRKTIKQMAEEGRFAEFLSPEAWADVEKKTYERLQNSADLYTRYKIDRDAKLDEEQEELEKAELEFISGDMADRSTYFRKVQQIRANFAKQRRTLVDENGKYEKIQELFDYGRTTELGPLSNADPDVYDYASSQYYAILYDEEDGIVDKGTGEVDWDLRDQKIIDWSKDMAIKNPSLSDKEIKSYLLRVQRSAKKDAPPVAGAMLEMSDKIAESGYYDIRDNVANEIAANIPDGQQALELYKQWKRQTQKDRETTENKNRRFFRLLSSVSKREQTRFLRGNPEVESMILIIGKYDKTLYSPKARAVERIFEQNKKTPMSEKELLAFFNDILLKNVTHTDLYSKYFRNI